MLQLTGKTDEQILRLFNISTNKYDALNYNLFLNDKFYNNLSIVEALYSLQYFNYKKTTKPNKRLSNSLNINIALDFFEKLGLKNLIEPIINGFHPMFETIIDKNSDSSVGHHANSPKLSFCVGDTGTVNGLINLVHESSHAINGFCTHTQQLLIQEKDIAKICGYDSEEFKAQTEKFSNFIDSQSTPEKDCCKEIESAIIELLLLEFLEKQNTISPEDKENYLSVRNNSFKNNLILIFKEDFIYSTIREIKNENGSKKNKLSKSEFDELKLRLQSKHHYNEVLDKIYDIALDIEKRNVKKNSRYRLRYVVGEIFSTVWFEKYIKSNKKEKQQMLNNYKSFLLNNHNYDLNSSLCLLLPDFTFETLIKEFKSIQQSKTENLNI